MLPAVSVSTVKGIFPNSVIKNVEGIEVVDIDDLIATGYKIIIDEIEWQFLNAFDSIHSSESGNEIDCNWEHLSNEFDLINWRLVDNWIEVNCSQRQIV